MKRTAFPQPPGTENLKLGIQMMKKMAREAVIPTLAGNEVFEDSDLTAFDMRTGPN